MIIISPYSKPLRNGNPNHPKNYPFWQDLISEILYKYPTQTIVQVGVKGEEQFKNTHLCFNQSLNLLRGLLLNCDTWISVDNFFHHLASTIPKRGIVLFGQSDPKIFGDPNNINLYRQERFFRENQFDFWENAKYRTEAFVLPQVVMMDLNLILGE